MCKWCNNFSLFPLFSQVGLFRKSGVKSRIQTLRQMNEASGADGTVSYEGQSTYDVADMLKQYFRDLPEPLFSSKLSETFLQIYQCKNTHTQSANAGLRAHHHCKKIWRITRPWTREAQNKRKQMSIRNNRRMEWNMWYDVAFRCDCSDYIGSYYIQWDESWPAEDVWSIMHAHVQTHRNICELT